MVSAFERSNVPDLVLRNDIKVAPAPSFSPKSLAMERMYVPLEQVISKSISGKRSAFTKKESISIGLAFSSMVFPSRANSYALLPSICLAEKSGGTCICIPTTDAAISVMALVVMCLIGNASLNSVSKSYEGVVFQVKKSLYRSFCPPSRILWFLFFCRYR